VHSETTLAGAIWPYAAKHGFQISAAGIRYGSVLYIAFGQGVSKIHRATAATTQYPVELEFGSDNWKLIRAKSCLLDSGFSDVNDARNRLQDLLVGNRIIGIELSESISCVLFNDEINLCSEISSAPEAGFLYSFYVEGGPSWETVDGINFKFAEMA
jgi:hypothetical protein